MKKAAIGLLFAFILTIAGTTGTWAVLPGYEDVVESYKIADYTLEFWYANGMKVTGIFPIYKSTRYTNDEVIEQTLKGCWTMNETYIRRITHVNGEPIENTKWAKYGGVIQHIGGNYQFPEDSVEPVPIAAEVSVFINGKQVEFPDQKPIIIQGRTMVPLRAIFEHPDVQAEVKWNEEERTVTATDRAGKTIVFRIGENNFRVITGLIEELKTSDVAPVIENNRTLLPLRALSEALNFKVDWIEGKGK
ncbi:MAG: copper amine oxidase N-terminal domain-containing protein [Peptococcia bacterium]